MLVKVAPGGLILKNSQRNLRQIQMTINYDDVIK